jgi:hypothetical protein
LSDTRKKLTPEIVRAIRVEMARGMSNVAIAAAFGVSAKLVSMIRNGTAWATVR